MSLAQEVATKGVTVNTVSPGIDRVRAVRPEVLDAIVQSIPIRRLGQTSEIASIVSWLAGVESGFAIGADFSLNGDLHMDQEIRPEHKGRSIKAPDSGAQ
jgi:acetoacetyl-CoA reductase